MMQNQWKQEEAGRFIAEMDPKFGKDLPLCIYLSHLVGHGLLVICTVSSPIAHYEKVERLVIRCKRTMKGCCIPTIAYEYLRFRNVGHTTCSCKKCKSRKDFVHVQNSE